MLTFPVQETLVKHTGLNQILQDFRSHALWLGHLEIHAPGRHIQRRIAGHPVRHHKTVVTPHISEHIIVQILAL